VALLEFQDEMAIGAVFSVDTATVIVKVDELEKLRKLQVNHLIAIRSSKAGQYLIGIINRITRKLSDEEKPVEEDMGLGGFLLTENILRVNLIGSFFQKHGKKENVFKRNLDTVPEIEALCFAMEGENITKFMNAISSAEDYKHPLSIGRYSIDEKALAFLDGDKLFQRHAVIVGSTGSGKSWCVAKLIEQIAKLPMANCLLFDIHGEYSGADFKADGIQHLRIANPSDLGKKDQLAKNIVLLPYWLLTYEEMLAMLLDRTDGNAPNQTMLFSKLVFEEKQSFLNGLKEKSLKEIITIDSPVPYDLTKVLKRLEELDEEMVPGARGDKAGPFNGKLTRFVQRLKAKCADRRLGFLFQLSEEEMKLDWMESLCLRLMGASDQNPQKAGVKIIDFSEVPSDILPLVIGLVARLIFSVQQWTTRAL